jgi:Fe-S cluster assembly protein SufB
MEYAPKGVSEDIVRLISNKNSEPEWMTTWRLEAYRRWTPMSEPDWPMLKYKKLTIRINIIMQNQNLLVKNQSL